MTRLGGRIPRYSYAMVQVDAILPVSAEASEAQTLAFTTRQAGANISGARRYGGCPSVAVQCK